MALKDESVLPCPGLFKANLLQPGKQPLSARANEGGLLFVFRQTLRLADDQERCTQVIPEDRRGLDRNEVRGNKTPPFSYFLQYV
ncbi:MAG: hypothetical protein R6U51_05030 [Anaerolineales bacterium]